MIEAAHRQELIDTLKAVNNASVSIRLYPPNSPQITNGIERGYKQLKQFLRNHGTFTLALGESGAELGGEVIPEETLKGFSNIILFRQLELLDQNCLALGSGIDRTVFKKLLELFSAKVDRIKEEGGGQSFISRLGLRRYFPDNLDSQASAAEDAGKKDSSESKPNESSRIPPEYINVLLGRRADSDVFSRVGQLMFSVEKGSVLLAGAVATTLGDILRKGIFGSVPALTDVFKTAEPLIPDENKETMARTTAAHLLSWLDMRATALLFAHHYNGSFGNLVSQELIKQITLEKFEKVIGILRQKSDQLRQTQTSESPQLVFISAALSELLLTSKGKQFLGQEKAKNLLKEGEQNRLAQRVQSSVKSLMKGNRTVLKSDEFCLHLPIIVKRLKDDGRDKEVSALLAVLLDQARESEGTDLDRMNNSLVRIAENLIQDNHIELVEDLVPGFITWLKEYKIADEGFVKCCFVLQALMNHLYKNDVFDKGDAILGTMYRLRSGAADVGEDIRNTVAKTQDNGLDRQVVKMLLDMALENPGDEAKSRRVILQGPLISDQLIEALMHAENSQDRMKILDLLTRGEQSLAPIVVKKLDSPMPWYGKRNLLKLLSDCGDESHIDIAYPFLQNEDLRVQREAFICLYKISGKQRKRVLLKALNDAGETIKLEIVRALVNFGDVEVVRGFGQVLQDYMYYSDEFRDTLLSETCRALGHCRATEAEKALQNFLQLRESKSARRIGEKVWQTAEDGIKQQVENQQDERARQARASKLRKNALTRISSVSAVQPGRRSITGLAEERKIQELFEKKDFARARVMLQGLVAKVLRFRRFTQAEQLREWLVNADASAISEIVKLADMIEEAKKSSVAAQHLELWSDLLDSLTSEEFSALYHNLVTQLYEGEESVVSKGDIQNSLYFINSGKIKLFYPDKDGEVLVTVLGSGAIFGADTFFASSVWTVSASTVGPAELALLTRSRLDKLRDEYPGLDEKLRQFCSSTLSMEHAFQNAENDRRRDERQSVSGNLEMTMLSDNQTSSGITVKGDLQDIATGGLSFIIRIPKKESSRLFLGRSVKLILQTVDSDKRTVALTGDIVAVRSKPGDGACYTIHVEFKKPLDPGYLQKIVQIL